ncbi:6-aminohexanoate-dimer hydrolase [Alphaproteobacteria bacterium SO-S41]|nr:6-aminohexanoate-dimer hydrolase [Alphaproteobacteria bacterium SO-S41]
MSDAVDPNSWMQGFPPKLEERVLFADPAAAQFPKLRWALNHYRELVPTKPVRRAPVPSVLPRAAVEAALDALPVRTMTGEDTNWADGFASIHTDGLLVLHRGRVVYERYFGACRPEQPHLLMSVSKSFVGLIAQWLVHDGALDENAPVTNYIPELKGTAYDDAIVRNVMDMRIGVKYSELYTDPNAEVFDYARAAGMTRRPPDYSGPEIVYDFLRTLKKEGPHGEGFAYKTVSTEVLGWIVKRVTGKPLATLVSERIWSRIGTEEDAYFMIDTAGTEIGGGGLNATLRDIARVGELMRNRGAWNGEQIIPAAVIDDIAKGSSQEAFSKGGYTTLPGWSYRNMWWVSHNPHGAYMARGIYGQSIFVDPKAEMVITRLGSHTIAANTATDPVVLPAYQAAAEALMAGKV